MIPNNYFTTRIRLAMMAILANVDPYLLNTIPTTNSVLRQARLIMFIRQTTLFPGVCVVVCCVFGENDISKHH